MKKVLTIIFIILGLAIGVFFGLGKFAGVEWVIFLIIFPFIYIFGVIIFGKDNDEELIKKKDKDKFED